MTYKDREEMIMAFCSRCGKEISDDAAFCASCGKAVSTNTTTQSRCSGTIHFKRESCYVAKFVRTKVIVDNNIYGELKENENLSVHLPFGYHNVELKVAGNPSSFFQVNIDANNQEIYYPFKISMMGKPVFCGNSGSMSSTQSTKPKKEKIGSLTTIGLFLVAVFFILIRIIGLSGSDTDTAQYEATTQQKSAETQQLVSEPIFTPVTNTVGNWEVTINDFNYQESVSIGLLHEYRAEENSKYCIINLTVKNCGKEADTFLPYITFDGDTTAKIQWNGYEYTRSELLWSDDNLSSETLNPLVSTSGDLAFEIPNEAIESDIPPVLVITSGESTFNCELVKK